MTTDNDDDRAADAPRVSFTFVSETSESIVHVLFREQRVHFCAHSHCKRLVAKGRVQVGGHTAHVQTQVLPGQVVSFQPTHEVIRSSVNPQQRKICFYERVPVIFENEHIGIVVKPPGLVMDSSGTAASQAKSSLRSLATILPFTLYPSSAPDALVVPAASHRLDAPVGGLVACVKTRCAARQLQKLFASRRVCKTYVAVLAGTPTHSTGEIREPIGGKASLTCYRVLSSQPSTKFGSLALIQLQPHTGRTHQLRRHCAEVLDCPIVGDTMYGGKRVVAAQALYLWASALELGVSARVVASANDYEAPLRDGQGDDSGTLDSGEEHGCEGSGETASFMDEVAQHVEMDSNAEQTHDDGWNVEFWGDGTFRAPLPPKFSKLLHRNKKAWEIAVLREHQNPATEFTGSAAESLDVLSLRDPLISA